MPYVTQVAIGQREFLNVWGGDYPTPDGTGVRDYIHVVDLALGHLRAHGVPGSGHEGCTEVNLGTGIGYSVLDMVKALSAASGRQIPYRIAERRAGDVAACYAEPGQGPTPVGMDSAERGLQQMCEDAWRWQQGNPTGLPQAESKACGPFSQRQGADLRLRSSQQLFRTCRAGMA